MVWPALRSFLRVPPELTGRGVKIAIVDGTFVPHPDVASTERRSTHHVLAAAPDPRLERFDATEGPWTRSAQHGTWAAAAAAGSGTLSDGLYAGVAPEAELYLVAGFYRRRVTPDTHTSTLAALRWLCEHARELGIRGVIPATTTGTIGTGLLPWQLDPVRVACEVLSAQGILVVAGTGNHSELTCAVTQAQAPSTLAVGGVVLPPVLDGRASWGDAAPFWCCRGETFEGRWVPELLAPADNMVLPLLGTDEERAGISRAGSDGVPDGYIRTDGTSFSGPAVLGAAACLWQAHPEWTAADVRHALVTTATHRPRWESLRAGLVSVEAASTVRLPSGTRAAGEPGETDLYARYRRWRAADVTDRLTALSSRYSAVTLDALLSFLPPDSPMDGAAAARVVGLLRGWLDGGSTPQLAAGALCVLASGAPEALPPEVIGAGMRHADPRVRAAALFTLERATQAWAALADVLAERFTDPQQDVRRAALRLAGKTGDRRYIHPLLDGLEREVQERSLACYAARRSALTAIAGVEISEDPPWRPGDSPRSDERWRARSEVARAWQAWAADEGVSAPVRIREIGRMGGDQ